MLSLPKHLARAARDSNPNEAVEMLRQAQHDVLFSLMDSFWRLQNRAAVAHGATGLHQRQAAIGILGQQKHSLALNALDFAGR